MESQSYDLPVLANPGNVVQETYTAQEVEELLRAFIVEEVFSVTKVFRSEVIPSALHWIFSRVSPDRAEAFFRALAEGAIPPGERGAGLRLLTYRLRHEATQEARLKVGYLAALTIKTPALFA